jgi:hypothetical protein
VSITTLNISIYNNNIIKYKGHKVKNKRIFSQIANLIVCNFFRIVAISDSLGLLIDIYIALINTKIVFYYYMFDTEKSI